MLGPDPSIHGYAGLRPLHVPGKHRAAERWILASAREYDGWCRRSAAGRCNPCAGRAPPSILPPIVMLGLDPSIHGRAGLKPLRASDKHDAAERWILASAREYDG
jgi:hypothetical protein